MATVTASQLDSGITIYCDGGSRNNQNAELRQGYGSFKVTKHGQYAETTYNGEKTIQHHFDYGNATNSVAELNTMLHALKYALYLRNAGWPSGVRICADSQNAILAATTEIAKPAAHLRAIYAEIRSLSFELRNFVQIVKMDERQIKKVLGH